MKFIGLQFCCGAVPPCLLSNHVHTASTLCSPVPPLQPKAAAGRRGSSTVPGLWSPGDLLPTAVSSQHTPGLILETVAEANRRVFHPIDRSPWDPSGSQNSSDHFFSSQVKAAGAQRLAETQQNNQRVLGPELTQVLLNRPRSPASHWEHSQGLTLQFLVFTGRQEAQLGPHSRVPRSPADPSDHRPHFGPWGLRPSDAPMLPRMQRLALRLLELYIISKNEKTVPKISVKVSIRAQRNKSKCE